MYYLITQLIMIYGKDYVQDRINGLLNIKNTHAKKDHDMNMDKALRLGFGSSLDISERARIIRAIERIDFPISKVELT